jgi:Carboxypeptidase regulatory-like domain/TonB-dependent Receptor Plug Domain
MSLSRLIAGRSLSLAALTLALTASRVVAAQEPARDSVAPTSVLIGRIVDSTGAGVPSAEVSLLSSATLKAISNDSGAFRLSGLPTGTVVIAVRRIGFEAATFTVVLRPGKTHRANFPLAAAVQTLTPVAVLDTVSKSHWLDRFEAHRTTNRGTFITRADIEKHGARTGTDIVRTVAGIRIVPLPGLSNNQVVMTRGAGGRNCLPAIYVQGLPFSGTMDDFAALDVEAVEVYVGLSEIPPELMRGGRLVCGAIVVWTRDPGKKP